MNKKLSRILKALVVAPFEKVFLHGLEVLSKTAKTLVLTTDLRGRVP